MNADAWRFAGLFAVSFCLISACAAKDVCRPGNHDGAWRNEGPIPPDSEEIRRRLIGMHKNAANTFMRAESVGVAVGENEDGSARYWTYQSMKKLTYRSCISADRVSYRQDIFWVRARVRENKVISCSMGIKGSIADKERTASEILASSLGPLDRDMQDCIPDHGRTAQLRTIRP